MTPTELSNLVSTIPEVSDASSMDVGFESVSFSDISQFEASLEQANLSSEVDGNLDIVKAALEPFNNLNQKAAELAEFASNASENGDGFTPSEIVKLTYKAQEFGFHSQLTANVANRLADGIQQLFRQQG